MENPLYQIVFIPRFPKEWLEDLKLSVGSDSETQIVNIQEHDEKFYSLEIRLLKSTAYYILFLLGFKTGINKAQKINKEIAETLGVKI